MNTRTFLPTLGLVAAVSLSAGFALPQTTTSKQADQATKQTDKKADKNKMKVKIGQMAPDFTLKDTMGKEHKLSQYKGKTVILEWINPKCPYCVGVMKTGKVAKMIGEAKKIDPKVVFLAINSTSFMEAKDTADYFKQHKLEKMTGLVDKSGAVGKLYGAKTTPHVYLIDAKGVLRFQGAFDDDRRGQKGDEAMNYIVNAMKQIKAGETVAPDTVKPWGCSVKYAKK